MLDALQAVRQLEKTRERLDDSRHVTMIDTVIKHTIAEIVDEDLDTVMETLVDDPVYHFYVGSGGDGRTVRGSAAIREMYSALRGYGPNAVQLDLSHVLVNDIGVVLQGTVSMLGVRAQNVIAGFSENVKTDGRDFIVEKAMLVINPFRDGLMIGEDVYTDGPYTIADVRYV